MTAAASPPEPLKLREQAYEGYTQSVLNGALRPGQFITQRGGR
jgi:hypothetical protein